MPRTSPAQYSFAGGEWGPLVYGRADLQKYFVSLRTCENYIVTPQGPVIRRSGTKYVARGGDDATAIWIRKFQFSTQQAYVLEFGANYLRVFKDGGGVLEDADNITAATAADPVEITHDGTAVVELDTSNADAGVTFSNMNLTAQVSEASTYEKTVLVTGAAKSSGKWYFEVRYDSRDSGSFNTLGIGIAVDGFDCTESGQFGVTNLTVRAICIDGYLGDIHDDGTPTAKSYTFAPTNVIMVALDMDAGNLWFGKNGSWFGGGNPALGTSPDKSSLTGSWVPGFGAHDSTGTFTATATMRVSSGAFSYAPPSGFSAWDTQEGYSDGDEVYISGVAGMTELNGNRYRIANTTSSTFTLQDLDFADIDGSAFTAYSSAGTVARIHEVATPYAAADLAAIKTVQSADVMYLAHQSYKPRKLSRTGDAAWTLAEVDFKDGPYLPVNDTATTAALGATSGTTTLTFSSTLGVNGGSGLQSTDVGRLFRYRNATSAAWAWGIITAVTSTLVCTVSIQKDAAGTTASTEWRLGVWSDTTGWPSAVTFFEDRLVWGGATDYPNRLDGSVTGDYENYQPDDQSSGSTVRADDAVAFTLVSREVNAIKWMAEDEKGLFVGTTGGEWLLRASNGDAISAENPPRARRSTRFGSSDVAPVETGTTLLFVTKDQKQVRELAYVFELDGFRAPEMTLLVDHIKESTFVDLDYQASPYQIAWGPMANGTLAGFTYERDQEVTAWHRHILGGTSTSGGAAAAVESCTVIPQTDGTRDQVWVVVKRYINGQTVRFIEYFEAEWGSEGVQEDAFFVDCGLTYDGSATTTITGLDHLEGETVQILADGGSHADKTVTNGTVTLDREASVVHIGCHKDARIRLSFVGAGQQGSPLGKLSRIHEVSIRVLNSLGGKQGRDFDNLVPVRNLSLTQSGTWGTAPPLYTGWCTDTFNGEHTDDTEYCFVQDKPLPSIIQVVRPLMETQER